jgi:hypothetical protein
VVVGRRLMVGLSVMVGLQVGRQRGQSQSESNGCLADCSAKQVNFLLTDGWLID